MGLFSGDSKSRMKREAEQRAREREKRNREYLKKQHRKKDRQTKEKAEQQDAQYAENWLGRVLDFFNGLIDLFVPTKSRTRHDRLTKQGAMFFLCLTAFGVGLFICNQSYSATELKKAQTSSFMTSDLSFSQTDATVTTNNKPFITQDLKTVYIPFKITDMDHINPDASAYHIFIMPKTSDTLNYRIENVQLVSYGSTGTMFIQVNTAQPITSQPLQFIIWSGDKLANDTYNPDQDSADANEFVKIKKKYDTLAFTINLGGKGVREVPQFRMKRVKATKRVKDPKTKKFVTKTYIKNLTTPIQANADLYNDNTKLQFVYNRIHSQKYVDSQVANAEHDRARMQLAINRINKDYSALKRAGYKLPKLPDWSDNVNNNASDGLPVSYDDLLRFNMLNPHLAFNNKVQTTLNRKLVAYNKAQSNDSSSSDDDTDDGVSSTSKEGLFLSKLGSMSIRNRHTGVDLNNTSSDNDQTASSNEQTEWSELQTELTKMAQCKTDLYYTIPLNLWDNYQDFLRDTSAGSQTAKKMNTGAITYSKMHGYDKHGAYLTIVGQPSTKKK